MASQRAYRRGDGVATDGQQIAALMFPQGDEQGDAQQQEDADGAEVQRRRCRSTRKLATVAIGQRRPRAAFATAGPRGRPELRGLEGRVATCAALTAGAALLAALRRIGAPPGNGELGEAMLAALEMTLALAVLAIGARRHLGRAWWALLHGRVDRYLVVAVALFATFTHGILGLWAPAELLGPEIGLARTLPSLALGGAMVTLLLLGEWLERCEGVTLLSPGDPASGRRPPASTNGQPFVAVVDYLSRHLTWMTAMAAVLGFAAWATFGPEPRASNALMSALSALMAACPTALGLVAPLAVRTAVDRADARRVHFRGFPELELLRRVDTVVMSESALPTEAEQTQSAQDAIKALRQDGVRVVLLAESGRQDTDVLARRYGFDDARPEVLPEARGDELRPLRAGGRTIAWLTDGEEDLAAAGQEAHLVVGLGRRAWGPAASYGLRLGSASLQDLVMARRLSRESIAVIKENIAITFMASGLAVPLAAGALSPALGPEGGPLVAALATAASVAAVVLNSLRLRGQRLG